MAKDTGDNMDAMGDFFDDEQELMAAAGSDGEVGDKDTAKTGDQNAGKPAEKSSRKGSVSPKASKKPQASAKGAQSKDAGNQAPPFWMVVAIAVIALVLGIVIGYLIGSAAAFAELSAASEQAATQQGTDGSVQMPEGHPEVSVDDEGNATVEDGEASADAAAADDPLTRANSYFDMGMAAMNAAKDEESQAKAVDLFNQAVVLYDEYLAMHESPSATVDRAICVFYGGDHEGAIADLVAFTEEDATFAPAWANLGMFYESHDEKDKAVNAYEQALKAAEKEDTYGVRGYAQERLDALTGK